jgi:membrane fusion protein, copper/silver efflux system
MKRTFKSLAWGAAALVALAGMGEVACRAASTGAGGPGVARAVQYRCPMHPSYVSDKPGNCPICGMKLVAFEPSPGAAPPASTSAPTADRSTLLLSPERRQMLGVRSEPVRRVALERTIRTVGRIAVDETRLHHVHTKYEAYVEQLHVDFTGKFVRKGQPLLSLYSPELMATQQEYLLAYRAQKQLGASQLPEVARGGVDLLEATRQRLLLWDIRPSDIAALERTGEVQRTLSLYSPVSGYVVQKTAYHGMRVTSADALFDIADLSHLWVLADVYESDLAAVRLGMPAEVTVTYLPGRTWRGRVTNVAPMVEEKTRTIKVRVEVDNADQELKPEMFADVVLRASMGTGLVVPESAVVRAGERQLVFLDLPGGAVEPRAVQLGAKVAAGVEVLGGLAEGERIVSSANFLLDSESSLKATVDALATAPPGAPAAAPQRAGADHAH